MSDPSAMPIDLANVLAANQRAAADLPLAEEPANFAAVLDSEARDADAR